VLHPAQIRQKANLGRHPPDPRRDPVCRSASPSVKGRASYDRPSAADRLAGRAERACRLTAGTDWRAISEAIRCFV
jgi:hypothetical protein